MLKKSFRQKSAKSIGTLLSVSALTMGLGLSQPAFASDPFLGEIKMVGFTFAPRGYADCNGQLLAIASNTALFSLLGTTYGGDGRTTFGLPDLRGRSAIHPGTGSGLSTIVQGQRGGAETHTLSIQQLPSHNHAATLHATDTRGNSSDPDTAILASKPRTDIYSNATPNVTMSAASVTTTNTGGNQSFNIRDPFLGIRHVIAIVGLFPSRN